MNDGTCTYAGPDGTATVGSNADNAWFSRCNCDTVTCESGTYDEARLALQAHRGDPPDPAP